MAKPAPAVTCTQACGAPTARAASCGPTMASSTCPTPTAGTSAV
jgi:hypothetical protein